MMGFKGLEQNSMSFRTREKAEKQKNVADLQLSSQWQFWESDLTFKHISSLRCFLMRWIHRYTSMAVAVWLILVKASILF